MSGRIIILILLMLSALLFAKEDSIEVKKFYSDVVQIARQSVGMRSLPPVGGKHFTQDCIGFIRYVYTKAGFDPVQAYGIGRGGVSSLYDGLYKLGFAYDAAVANPGDLVFFDNTYDVNRDGKWNDPLSHIGIVAGIGKHNTIFYIHYAGYKVEMDEMNLCYPSTHAFKQSDGQLYIINSYLRRNRGEGYDKKEYVSSSFYHAFAHIRLKIKS